jgi:WD40 repeat protein
MRRSLVVGVTSFTRAEGDGEPDLDGLPGLPFAEELAAQVRDGLGAFGYESDLVVGGAALTAQMLGSTVRDFLQNTDRDDLAVIHVISHGQIVGRGDLHAIGSDGLWHETTDVEQWLKIVDKSDKGPMALFLLDLCYSGAAARLPWQLEAADGSARSWVLAASERERQAYDGQFSRAVIRVLADLAAGRIEIDEAVEFVPLQTIGRAVRREVARLASRGYRQNVTASVLDMAADPNLRFFPNRAFRRRAGTQAPRVSLDVALTPFADQLDEVIDAWHFVSRAAGSGPVQEQPTVGFFRGRSTELATLSHWIDGEGEPGSRLVTGSPGTGKSALLGVLVCAAHPLLRDATEHLWRGTNESPGSNAALAAVHARNRRLDDVVRSLRRQLHLPVAISESASDLIDGIKSLEAPPVVIIDALDEADNPNALLTILLLPLIHSQRANGSPICRLIVGSRTGTEWPQLEPLRRAISGNGEIIDLDDVPAERLETDLCRYLDDLLRTRSPYKDAAFGPGRRRIAAAAGNALAHQDRAQRRWGEFLVAGLFAHHILSLNPPVTTEQEVEDLVQRIPRTLPEVLEMDLRVRQVDNPWVRPVLTALAHAAGDGLPASLVGVVATALTPHQSAIPPTRDDVMDALASARFYVRRSVEVDGETLYRLFHQGLADHLRASSPNANFAPRWIFNRLLADIGTGADRDWRLAHPYLLRHAPQHAAEAGQIDELLSDLDFLVNGDPDGITPHLDHADSHSARLAAAIYRASSHRHRSVTPRDRRQILAIDAARLGVIQMAANLCASSEGQAWAPRWATGSHVTSALLRSMTQPGGRPGGAIACAELDDRPIAVTGGADGLVRIWDLSTGRAVGEPLGGHEGAVFAVALTDLRGRPIAVTGGADGLLRFWDLGTKRQLGNPLTGHRGPVRVVACTEDPQGEFAVTGGADGSVRVWDLEHRRLDRGPLRGHRGDITAAAYAQLGHSRDLKWSRGDLDWDRRDFDWDGRNLEDRGDFGWDRMDLNRERRDFEWRHRPLEGDRRDFEWRRRPLGWDRRDLVWGPSEIVTSGADGSVRVWHWATPRLWHDDALRLGHGDALLLGHDGAVAAVDLAVLDQRLVAVSLGEDGSVLVWNLGSDRSIGEPLRGHGAAVIAVDLIEIDGHSVAVTGGADAAVRVWDLRNGHLVTEPFRGSAVSAIVCAEFDGQQAVVAGGEGGVRIWKLGSKRPTGRRLRGRDGPVWALDCARLNGIPVAVTGGDGFVRVWNLRNGRVIGKRLEGHTGAVTAVKCAQLDGFPIAVTGGADGSARVWNLPDGCSIGDPLRGHDGAVSALDCAELDGIPVALTGGTDGYMWVWNLRTGLPIGDRFRGQDAPISAIHCLQIGRRPVVVTGGIDGMVRIWDVASRRILASVVVPGRVAAISASSLRELIICVGSDVMVLKPTLQQEKP